MASFIILTIADEAILKEITTKYQAILSQENINKLLLGNLIVDSIKKDTTIHNNLNTQEIIDYKMDLKKRNRQEKIITHFRNPNQEHLCQKFPESQRFINKY